MFLIQSDKSIHITRGDVADILVEAKANDEKHLFAAGDVVRLTVFERKNSANVVLRKDVTVEAECEAVTISLDMEDTKIGGCINQPTVYRYEIELNPDTCPNTIVGYGPDGEKVFCIYPEGGGTA